MMGHFLVLGVNSIGAEGNNSPIVHGKGEATSGLGVPQECPGREAIHSWRTCLRGASQLGPGLHPLSWDNH